jgi:phosphoglycolate phosphatase
MSLNTPEMVLFDLDGTLIDTVPDLAYSVDTMLQKIDLPKRGEEKIRTWVGDGVERLVKRALTNDFDAEPQAELFNKAFPLFLEIYADNVCQRSLFYDGVKEGIYYLRENNFKLGCVTNKREQFTHTLLKSLGLYDDFGIAGYQIACVSYGYNLGENIRAANPDIVIDSLAELPQLI